MAAPQVRIDSTRVSSSTGNVTVVAWIEFGASERLTPDEAAQLVRSALSKASKADSQKLAAMIASMPNEQKTINRRLGVSPETFARYNG